MSTSKKKPAKKRNPHAMALVRARMKKTSAKQRTAIARKAANARWAARNGNSND